MYRRNGDRKEKGKNKEKIAFKNWKRECTHKHTHTQKKKKEKTKTREEQNRTEKKKEYIYKPKKKKKKRYKQQKMAARILNAISVSLNKSFDILNNRFPPFLSPF